MKRLPLIASAVALLLLLPGSARADLLSVGAGSWSDVGTGTETWNRGTSPSGSLSITIPVLNGTSPGSQTATMFGWALGIEIVPQTGATGTLTISSLANPSNNALNGNPGSPSSFVGNPSGPNTYTVISNTNNNTVGSQVPSSGDNLVSFNVTSSNASGTFKIIAFNDSSNGYSNWTYYNAANGSDPNNGNDFAFTNISATGSFPSNSPAFSTFTLGTINVLSPAAVPEPGSIVLAGIAAAGYAGYGWRRKRRKAGEPLPPADSSASENGENLSDAS